MKQVFMLLALACLGALALAPSASAASAPCAPPGATVNANIEVPPNGACRLEQNTINGNVRVHENAGLVVAGSTINGNVRGSEARFFGFTDATTPPGPTARNTIVNGSVEFVETRGVPMPPASPGSTHNFVCDRTRITGSLSVRHSEPTAPFLFGAALSGNPSPTFPLLTTVGECEDPDNAGGNRVDTNYEALGNEGEVRNRENTVAGSMTIIENQGPGMKDVHNNNVGNDLLCLDNQPPPTSGGNQDGKPEDHPEEQCQG